MNDDEVADQFQGASVTACSECGSVVSSAGTFPGVARQTVSDFECDCVLRVVGTVFWV